MQTLRAYLSCAGLATHKEHRSAGKSCRFATLLCLLALLCPLGLHAQNFVYVNNQSGVSNSVASFSVDAGGVLTSLGTVSTGGTGATVACAGIDRITVNLASNLLFVSNSGDQTISVFHITPATGALSAVAGSPFASGLTLDSCAGISLAATPDGHFLMASSNGQIKTFSVAVNGSLSLSSTTSLLLAPMVGMKISGDGRFLAVSHQASVSVFTISAVDGSLAGVAGSPFAKGGTGLVGGLDFNCDGTLLYAAEGGATSSITDAWSIAPSGALTPILGSPFTAAGSDSNVVFLTPDNTILYQSNQGSNDFNSFTVNADGTLTSIGLANIATGHVPAGLASDTSGLFLYSADDAFGAAVFNILPGVVPTLVGDTAITGAGHIQGVAAYPPRSCAHADFSISQTALPNPVTAGSQLTYTITVTNNGPNAASVAINDLLPRNFVTFVSCTPGPGGVCDKGAGLNRTITFASLASGQSGTATIVASTVSTLLNGDTISNTSAVSNASAVDPNPADNSAATSVTVSAPLSATNFIVANSTGNYFGTATLSTTLKRTLNGAAIAGRTITFSLDSIVVGTAVTGVNGVATLPNVSLVLGGIPITAGPHSIGVNFAGDSQFQASTGTSTLTVNKAVLSVTAQNASKTYGDANPAFTYVISGFLNNETVAVVSGTANCTSSANLGTSAGTAPISCAVGTLAATNYSFVFVPATLTINRAPLVLAGNSVSRLYGDPNPAITGTVSGLKAGDQATATFSTTALSTSPVGTYPITGTVVPGPSFLAANYSVTSSGAVTVNPALLTVAAANVSRVYGDANPVFSGTVTGLKNGDAITATFASATDATSAVGTYPITATLSDPGVKLGNYTVNSTGTLTITPAPLTVNVGSGTRLYGDANPPFTGTLAGLKNADAITATFSSAATAASPVGSYPVTATLADPGAKLGNYTVTSNNGSLSVTPAPLSVAAANASRLYGDSNPAFTGTITGIKNADNITATYASVADPTSPVGTFSIVPTLVDPAGTLGNYTVTSSNGSLTVTPAPLSVTAANATRLYGDANPIFTGTLSGLKNADNITASYASTATPASLVGAFAIVPTLADPASKLGNYTVTSNNGTLTISPAPLTVTAANATRLYGDPNPSFAGTIAGIKNSDNITATFSSVADATSAVGAFPITSALADPTSKLGNYTVNSVNGTLTISQAPLTVSGTNATRIYGDANPSFAGSISGLKNADNLTATFASAATAASSVGTYPIIASLVDPTAKLGNYAVTSNNGTLTVTQAPLAVSAGNATRLYGDQNPSFTGAITGLKNGDNITATFTGADPTSAVGTYTIVPSLVDPTNKLSNYAVTSTNGTLTITPSPLSVSPANASRLYGDSNPVFGGTITGIRNADNITATYASAATAASSVGTSPIVPTLLDPTNKLGNYTVTLSSGTLTIGPAPLTVSGASTSRPYGDPNPAFSGTLTGIKNADNITASFSSAANAASPVGGYPIVPALADPTLKLTNYSVTSNNGTLTVSPAALTLTGNNATRVYGDANPLFTGTVSGVKNADNITASATSAATAASPVGTYPIVPSAVDPTGKLGNYTVTVNNGTLTVTVAPLSVTAGNATRLYGDPNPAFTGTITGLKNGDNITAVYAGADPTSAVGTYTITPSLVDPGAKLGNYSVTSTNGNLTVTQAPLTVTAANSTRFYGDPNPVFAGTLIGIKNADNITASFISSATLTSPVGPYLIIPSLTDPTLKLGNYTVTSNNGTLTVSPAALTVAGANANRLYGDANPSFSATITGLKNGDNISATATSAATPASSVGAFPIVPGLADPTTKLGNYTVSTSNGTLTINPASLTVSGDPASRIYGDANPAFTGTITGVKNADNITATFATSAVAASPVGAFPILPTLVDPTAKLGNYIVTSNNGTLTITLAALSVTAGNASRLYGDPNPAFSGTIIGLKNGDNITAVYTGADPTSAVGTYTIVPSLVDPAGKLGNYTVTATNGTLTVEPAPLSVTAGNATRLYGDANPLFTGSIVGIKNADNITATFASLATQASTVGAFSIVPTLVDPAAKLGNYTITTNNGTLTISPAPLAVTGTNANRLYGDPNPAFTGTITGIKNADNITATFGSTTLATSPVGNYPIVPTLADPTTRLGNYAVTSTNGTLAIDQAPLTVNAASASRLYGDANPAFTGTITGLKNADNITATFSSAAGATSAVGTYPIVPNFVDPTAKLSNYAVTSNNATLTVTAVPLIVTAANASRLYGDANPLLTGTITGLRNADNITASFTSAGPASPVGSYPIVPALIDPTARLGNYTVTSNNGTLTVSVASLSVVAANATRPYGSANPAFTGTLTGVKNGDNISATFSSVADSTSAVGSYPIVPALADPTLKLSNYAVTSTSGTLTVSRAVPPVTITAQISSTTAVLVAQVANAGPVLPTGTVQFFEGGTALSAPLPIAPLSLGAIPQATLQLTLSTGAHFITANYSGDGTYTTSSAAPTTVVIGAPPTFILSGTGGNTSATIAAGQTATFNVTLNQQGFSGTVALACSGAPAGTTCNVNPSSVSITASSTPVPITVTVSNTQNARAIPNGFKVLFGCAGVLAGLITAAGKKRKQLVLMCLAAFLIVGMAACGGHGSSNPGPTQRVPTNATITLTGTSGSQTASINLNLTITH